MGKRGPKPGAKAERDAVTNFLTTFRAGTEPRFNTFNERSVKILLECISNGHYYKDACAAAGIAKRTFYNWLRDAAENPETSPARHLPALLEMARFKSIDISVKKMIESDDWKAHATRLERRHPERFGASKQREAVDEDEVFVSGASESAVNSEADILNDLLGKMKGKP